MELKIVYHGVLSPEKFSSVFFLDLKLILLKGKVKALANKSVECVYSANRNLITKMVFFSFSPLLKSKVRTPNKRTIFHYIEFFKIARKINSKWEHKNVFHLYRYVNPRGFRLNGLKACVASEHSISLLNIFFKLLWRQLIHSTLSTIVKQHLCKLFCQLLVVCKWFLKEWMILKRMNDS